MSLLSYFLSSFSVVALIICHGWFARTITFVYFRFGYGQDGKALEAETTVQRGPCKFHTNGNMTIKGVVYPPGNPSTAAGMVEAQAFQDAFDSCISSLDDGGTVNTKSEQLTATVRRLSTHVNSHNAIILFLLRSNMDLRVLLSDSHAKGIFYYVLNYATKSEQTIDVLLPLLLPVVERIRDQSAEESEQEIAVRLVRSCLCKQLTSLNIGGPAAASKIFGFPDAKISHKTTDCPTRPLLAWAASRDKPEDGGNGNSNEDQREDRNNHRDSECEDSGDDMGVVVSAVGGRLTVKQRCHLLYRSRCHPSDTEHPLHGMSYFVWHRLVRVERYKPKRSIDGSDDGTDDEETENDDEDEQSGEVTESPTHTAKKKGRPSCDRYDFVGRKFRKKWVQVCYTFLHVSTFRVPFYYFFHIAPFRLVPILSLNI